jgi:signal transduction histidine kinase
VIDLGLAMRVDRARLWVWQLVRGALFWKYVVLVGAAMGTALVLSSIVEIWFTARDHRAALVRIQEEQANAAAQRITQFVKEIEGQLGWMTHLSWANAKVEQREVDALRLLRQVPAISELALVDADGRERLWVSRQAMDRIESLADLSNDERVKGALTNKTYYGPVVFRRGTEPVMTLAVAGARRDAGVAIAEVNLTLIWDVIHKIKVGREGRAYVVGPQGRLIAHPDISLVLRNTDMSQLEHVRAARSGDPAEMEAVQSAINIQGERVLTAHAMADPLDWTVFVELPEAEANEPLYATVTRSIVIAVVGLAMAILAALLLARRMVVPIEVLSAGAARIGTGALDHRISIKTGDELEMLGQRFNEMASRLQASYATLERKVQERTSELQAANLSKSRFLAVASHDLRQPLHALNLLVAQLSTEANKSEQSLIASRVGSAIANMNELFNALLDISKLDAGALDPTITVFPLSTVLARIEETFGAAARDKGLHLAVVPSSCWVRSDAILVERILINLVSNAVRYTSEGGVVVGCRRKSDRVRIDVCDTGIGIPHDQQRAIFAEFYRGAPHAARGEGLGLGLAIVDRLCNLLDHPIEIASTPGKGTRLSISVPVAQPERTSRDWCGARVAARDPLAGKRVLVIDDDPLVLEATAGILRSWRCEVFSADSLRGASGVLGSVRPDLVISDYRLKDGQTGIEAIAMLRDTFGSDIPAFIVSGDVAPELKTEVQESGLLLVHKPLSPMALRAMATRLMDEKPTVAAL